MGLKSVMSDLQDYKDVIVSRYGHNVYNKAEVLIEAKKELSTEKNLYVFHEKCADLKRKKYSECRRDIQYMESKLAEILSRDDMQTVSRVAKNAREKKYLESKEVHKKSFADFYQKYEDERRNALWRDFEGRDRSSTESSLGVKRSVNDGTAAKSGNKLTVKIEPDDNSAKRMKTTAATQSGKTPTVKIEPDDDSVQMIKITTGTTSDKSPSVAINPEDDSAEMIQITPFNSTETTSAELVD